MIKNFRNLSKLIDKKTSIKHSDKLYRIRIIDFLDIAQYNGENF